MPTVWTRLHTAAKNGSAECVSEILGTGAIDIDETDQSGWTPLMVAATYGFSSVAKILLDKGANVSVIGEGGVAALHLSAQQGHKAVTKMLVDAGADPDIADCMKGDTPLHVAADRGHSEAMSVLIDAGANPNPRGFDGATPLYLACQSGCTAAIKLLLRAKANPLLTTCTPGKESLPLDAAAEYGRVEAVREMIQELGIEGCGGASGGAFALESAAQAQRLDTMAVLMDAGVVDSGSALVIAAGCGREASVKYLLQRHRKGASCQRTYVNFRDFVGKTALVCCVGFGDFFCPSPRIARLLVDAGANTSSKVRLSDHRTLRVVFNGTPLALANRNIREKRVGRKDATEQELNKVEGIRRVLLRVEAAHAASWRWPTSDPSIAHVAAGTGRDTTTPTPLTLMLPTLRRRARSPRLLAAALFRYSSKP